MQPAVLNDPAPSVAATPTVTVHERAAEDSDPRVTVAHGDAPCSDAGHRTRSATERVAEGTDEMRLARVDAVAGDSCCALSAMGRPGNSDGGAESGMAGAGAGELFDGDSAAPGNRTVHSDRTATQETGHDVSVVDEAWEPMLYADGRPFSLQLSQTWCEGTARSQT